MKSKKVLIERFLKRNSKRSFYLTELCRKLNITLSTVEKWVEILRLEKKIEIKEFGNMKMVRWKK